MKKESRLIEVQCPCCDATLKIDPLTATVILHKEKEKPAPIEDLRTAVSQLKQEAARRDEKFQKSFEDEKNRQDVLSKKFDELFKQAKSDPDMKPRRKEIDWD
ncbi:MAG: hypothetical protein JNN08_03885 [Bryobacterales bacterium]|nr:hypothetical protein [Bryobacterales bacterium]